MTWLWVWAVLLVLGVMAAWALNIVSLPGNWLAAGLIGLYAWLFPGETSLALGWPTVIVALACAGLGELVEFVAAALGAKRGGGGWRSSVGALLGSVVGAVFGAIVGVPIPLLGPLIAAVLFAALGAMAGAMIGERTTGREWHETLGAGSAAFSGRLIGTIGKLGCGALIIVSVIVGLVG